LALLHSSSSPLPPLLLLFLSRLLLFLLLSFPPYGITEQAPPSRGEGKGRVDEDKGKTQREWRERRGAERRGGGRGRGEELEVGRGDVEQAR